MRGEQRRWAQQTLVDAMWPDLVCACPRTSASVRAQACPMYALCVVGERRRWPRKGALLYVPFNIRDRADELIAAKSRELQAEGKRAKDLVQNTRTIDGQLWPRDRRTVANSGKTGTQRDAARR